MVWYSSHGLNNEQKVRYLSHVLNNKQIENSIGLMIGCVKKGCVIKGCDHPNNELSIVDNLNV